MVSFKNCFGSLSDFLSSIGRQISSLSPVDTSVKISFRSRMSERGSSM